VKLTVKIDSGVPRGVVHIPNHFLGAGCNIFTDSILDPVNKVPAVRFWPVALTVE